MAESFAEHKGVTLDEFIALDGMNVDSLEEAWWVCEYIKGVKDE